MKRWIAGTLAVVLLAIPAPVLAWWEYGHETVAAIAYRNIRPDTRAKVDALLKRSALLETPGCPARTLQQASVWADCIKPLGMRFSYAYSWHYQNVDVCTPFALKAACKDGHCVSAQVERAVTLLQDRAVPAREKVQALAFLTHFVGDLHMPLHAGDRGDLGGNQVKAAYGAYAPERLNLHSVWDGWLAERALSTPPGLARLYSPAERAAIQPGSVEDWSRESWQVSRDVAYATAFGGDPCGPRPARAQLDDGTIARLVEPTRTQVVRAGLRLARMLDEAFDPARASDSRVRTPRR